MAKLTLADLANLNNPTSAVTSINANNGLIEAALENTLSRDGTSPNEMLTNLDMNGFSILNSPSLDSTMLASAEASIAAGIDGTQANATQLNAVFNTIDTVSVKGDAVKLPHAIPGLLCYVNNVASNQFLLYPFFGDTIDTNGTDAPGSVNPFQAILFVCFVESQWIQLVARNYD